MERRTRMAWIAGGFALATAAALFVASGVWRIGAMAAAAQASSGMTAFGDLLAAVATFGLIAALPTWLALREMRGVKAFWFAWATVALAIAATGPVALAAWLAGWQAAPGSQVFVPFLFAIPRVVLSPFAAIGFGLSWISAPAGGTKWALRGACLAECAVAAIAIVHFGWLILWGSAGIGD